MKRVHFFPMEYKVTVSDSDVWRFDRYQDLMAVATKREKASKKAKRPQQSNSMTGYSFAQREQSIKECLDDYFVEGKYNGNNLHLFIINLLKILEENHQFYFEEIAKRPIIGFIHYYLLYIDPNGEQDETNILYKDPLLCARIIEYLILGEYIKPEQIIGEEGSKFVEIYSPLLKSSSPVQQDAGAIFFSSLIDKEGVEPIVYKKFVHRALNFHQCFESKLAIIACLKFLYKFLYYCFPFPGDPNEDIDNLLNTFISVLKDPSMHDYYEYVIDCLRVMLGSYNYLYQLYIDSQILEYICLFVKSHDENVKISSFDFLSFILDNPEFDDTYLFEMIPMKEIVLNLNDLDRMLTKPGNLVLINAAARGEKWIDLILQKDLIGILNEEFEELDFKVKKEMTCLLTNMLICGNAEECAYIMKSPVFVYICHDLSDGTDFEICRRFINSLNYSTNKCVIAGIEQQIIEVLNGTQVYLYLSELLNSENESISKNVEMFLSVLIKPEQIQEDE